MILISSATGASSYPLSNVHNEVGVVSLENFFDLYALADEKDLASSTMVAIEKKMNHFDRRNSVDGSQFSLKEKLVQLLFHIACKKEVSLTKKKIFLNYVFNISKVQEDIQKSLEEYFKLIVQRPNLDQVWQALSLFFSILEDSHIAIFSCSMRKELSSFFYHLVQDMPIQKTYIPSCHIAFQSSWISRFFAIPSLNQDIQQNFKEYFSLITSLASLPLFQYFIHRFSSCEHAKVDFQDVFSKGSIRNQVVVFLEEVLKEKEPIYAGVQFIYALRSIIKKDISQNAEEYFKLALKSSNRKNLLKVLKYFFPFNWYSFDARQEIIKRLEHMIALDVSHQKMVEFLKTLKIFSEIRKDVEINPIAYLKLAAKSRHLKLLFELLFEIFFKNKMILDQDFPKKLFFSFLEDMSKTDLSDQELIRIFEALIDLPWIKEKIKKTSQENFEIVSQGSCVNRKLSILFEIMKNKGMEKYFYHPFQQEVIKIESEEDKYQSYETFSSILPEAFLFFLDNDLIRTRFIIFSSIDMKMNLAHFFAISDNLSCFKVCEEKKWDVDLSIDVKNKKISLLVAYIRLLGEFGLVNRSSSDPR